MSSITPVISKNENNPENISKGYQRRVVHIKMSHRWTDPNTDHSALVPSEMDLVVKSQFNVVSAIRACMQKSRGRPCYVFQESLDDDTFKKGNLDPYMVHKVRSIFPKGFPRNPNTLNQDQRSMLYEQGGVFVIAYLEDIALRKTMHPELSYDIMEAGRSGNRQAIMERREEEAIRCIKEELPPPDQCESIALLVFGGAHNFQPLCEREGFSYSAIETVVLPL